VGNRLGKLNEERRMTHFFHRVHRLLLLRYTVKGAAFLLVCALILFPYATWLVAQIGWLVTGAQAAVILGIAARRKWMQR
jgi:hypothetical protein